MFEAHVYVNEANMRVSTDNFVIVSRGNTVYIMYEVWDCLQVLTVWEKTQPELEWHYYTA